MQRQALDGRAQDRTGSKGHERARMDRCGCGWRALERQQRIAEQGNGRACSALEHRGAAAMDRKGKHETGNDRSGQAAVERHVTGWRGQACTGKAGKV